MNTVAYRHIPSMKAVFRVQEDCCIEKVIYEGDRTQIGIVGLLDRYNEQVGPLLCACDPARPIFEISEQEYYAKRQAVCDRLAA